MQQYDLPSGPYRRNRQTLGSLQHAPQLTHCPLRLGETGSTDVNVLLIFADHVLLVLSAIAETSPKQD